MYFIVTVSTEYVSKLQVSHLKLSKLKMLESATLKMH